MAKKNLTDDEYIKALNEKLEENTAKGDNYPPFQFSRPIDPKLVERTKVQLSKALNMLPKDQGLFQTTPPEPTINFVHAPDEVKLISKTNNAGIIIGRDRPHVLASGKGGKGAAGANTIDIVVGRMSCKQKDISSGKIKAVEPNFGCDAARIYISQLTDVDLNFGLAPGIAGRADSITGKPSPSRSAIGMKADKVRIIGREGIKIVTGRSHSFTNFGFSGETNSLGGKIKQPAPPIELIAGNNTDTREIFGGLFNTPETVQSLQGIAYGEYTRDAIESVFKLVDLVSSALDRMAIFTEIFTSICGIAIWEPWRAGAAPVVLSQEMNLINSTLHQLRINKALLQTNYTKPYGKKYIVSQNVFAT